MTLGRTFTHDEHVALAGPNGPPPSAVISYRLWRDVFGGDPRVVGQTINVPELSGPIPVVGVAARDFDTPPGTDLWFNVRLDLKTAVTGSLPGSQGAQPGGYVRR